MVKGSTPSGLHNWFWHVFPRVDEKRQPSASEWNRDAVLPNVETPGNRDAVLRILQNGPGARRVAPATRLAPGWIILALQARFWKRGHPGHALLLFLDHLLQCQKTVGKTQLLRRGAKIPPAERS